MNVVHTTKSLASQMNLASAITFSEIDNLVVGSWQNRVLFTSTPITQLSVADQAQYCCIEFTTGQCQGIRCVIYTHPANPMQITCADDMKGTLQPQPGDLFRIYGGPLISGKCNVFWMQQDSFNNIPDQNFIIVVSTGGGNMFVDRQNGNQLAGLMSFRQQCEIEIMVLAPFITADASSFTAYNAAVLDIYTLVDQVRVFTALFRMSTVTSYTGKGPINWNYFWSTQEDGTLARQGCTITLTVESAG